MKSRNVVSLLLAALLLIALFAACATETPSGGGSEATPPAATPGNSSPTGSTPPNGSNSGNEGDGDSEDEIVEIMVWTSKGQTKTDEGNALVEAAVNEITEREIGVHVNFEYIPYGDLATQVTLAIANQEPIDLINYSPSGSTSIVSLYTNNAIMDLTDLIDAYAPDLKALFGNDLLNATSINGRLYGIPAYRLYNSNFYFVGRKDILENAGVLSQAEKMTSWQDLEACLEAIKNSNQGCYGFGDASGDIIYHGLIASGGSFADNIVFDTLGDSLDLIYTDQNSTVSLLPAQPGYVTECKMFQDWYSKGYIWSETPYTTKGDTVSNITNNVFASYVCASEYGVEVSKTAAIGTDVLCVQLGDGFVSTAAVLKFGLCIPSTSPEPEATMKFLNLLYTDDQLSTLFAWGIEGVHYEVRDGQAAYIGDATAATCGFHGNDYSFGNQFKILPWYGQGADFRTRAYANLQAAPTSKYLGFTMDTGGYQTELAAISAVVNEYNRMLTSGLYTDALYNEYLTKLDAAEIDQWVGLYQSALTDWLA